MKSTGGMPYVTLAIKSGEQEPRYVGDSSSCTPAPEGFSYIQNIDGLVDVIRSYLKPQQ